MNNDTIISFCQNSIIDNTTNKIEYSFTRYKDYIILHIYNPALDRFKINPTNNKIISKLITILYDKLNKKGCFNNDNDGKLNYSDEDLLNNFINIEYSFILLNKQYEPLSILCLSSDIIWNVCTNFYHRGKGYMTILLNHILKLILLDKLKVLIDKNNLSLKVKKDNPIKDKLMTYYNTFGFKKSDDNDIYIVMHYKNKI